MLPFFIFDPSLFSIFLVTLATIKLPIAMKRNISLLIVALLSIFIVFSCNKSSKKEEKSHTEKATESISGWMVSKTNEYPDYKSVEFGELTPRFQKSNRTYQLYNLIEEEKSKETPNQKTIDSLETLLNSNMGEFLGYTIIHKYNTKSVAGETILNENLFFLDSLFRIITILNADAYDQIMDEKLIFRQEIDSLNK